MTFFSPPVVHDVPAVLPDTTGVERALFRHYRGHQSARNVYYLTDGTVTERQPDDDSLVAHTWFGGHEPQVVTEPQAIALRAAGYTLENADTWLEFGALLWDDLFDQWELF